MTVNNHDGPVDRLHKPNSPVGPLSTAWAVSVDILSTTAIDRPPMAVDRMSNSTSVWHINVFAVDHNDESVDKGLLLLPPPPIHWVKKSY